MNGKYPSASPETYRIVKVEGAYEVDDSNSAYADTNPWVTDESLSNLRFFESELFYSMIIYDIFQLPVYKKPSSTAQTINIEIYNPEGFLYEKSNPVNPINLI